MLLAESLLGSSSAIDTAYIEDVFSTWLYTSTGGDITITNGIDLSTKGGLVWIKSRSNSFEHYLTDTLRGAGRVLYSNRINGQSTPGGGGASSFSSTGYVDGNQNANGITQVSWTFREQPRFFDIVTYTGNGANRTIAHSLGSVPGCIMVKRTDTTGDWQVYHRSLANTEYLVLNSTAAAATGATRWNSTTPTATEFSLGTEATVNANGGTYVAYLFAHDAGGFGATGADNVISCGSFTADAGSNATITLGYEPQWIMVKATTTTSHWQMIDIMRGDSLFSTVRLLANSSIEEIVDSFGYFSPTATGMTTTTAGLFPANQTFIYIAIRRGPMRTPTTGTSVFSPFSSSVTFPTTFSTGFVTDGVLTGLRNDVNDKHLTNRLTGGLFMNTNSTAAEDPTSYTTFASNTSFTDSFWRSGFGFIQFAYGLRRAPGFFDVVCYTGTGVARTVAHNLGVVPELMIFKNRGSSTNWAVYTASGGATKALYLNDSGTGLTSSAFFNDTAPTSSVFTVNFSGMTNDTAANYVAYLFASCPGVSKVGSYTGTGATQVINCGFAAGARFVLIKRTDSTGDWYVWDSARGIVAGNDPYLLLNSTAAEVTNTDWVDTAASGFELSNAGGNLVNTNGASYIFLAIA